VVPAVCEVGCISAAVASPADATVQKEQKREGEERERLKREVLAVLFYSAKRNDGVQLQKLIE
jgi:hypothetical protein